MILWQAYKIDVDLSPTDTFQKLLPSKKMSSLHAGVLLFQILCKGCKFEPEKQMVL